MDIMYGWKHKYALVDFNVYGVSSVDRYYFDGCSDNCQTTILNSTSYFLSICVGKIFKELKLEEVIKPMKTVKFFD